MKKILFLVQLPPPVHGASVVNKNIQDSHLINREFRTFYVNISPARGLSDIGKASLGKLVSTIHIIIRSISAFLKFKPDLVYLTLSPHGLAFYKDGLIALTIKFFGGELVFHLHGKGVRCEANRSWIRNKLYRLVFRNVSVIHLAKSLFSDLDGVRDESKLIEAIGNGIAPFEESTGCAKEEVFTFVYLSNIIREKGADVVVRAAELLPIEYQGRFQVKIIGKMSDGAYAREIEELIAKNSHKNIKFLGARYGAEKIIQLTSSHVFILPTSFKNECFPLSILEAMAAGLAVISTNEGAIPEIVEHGVTGDILVTCNPEALAQAMIKHLDDESYSKACSILGQERFLGEYTQDIFENKLLSTLKVLIK